LPSGLDGVTARRKVVSAAWTVLALGVGAMLAFDTGRRTLGGAMLAVAVLSKLFPGVLLVVLAAGRQEAFSSSYSTSD
jgi:ethanolamine transporter EutH